jgi:hypothetical protein
MSLVMKFIKGFMLFKNKGKSTITLWRMLLQKKVWISKKLINKQKKILDNHTTQITNESPQGFTLSTILFSIYTEPLKKELRKSTNMIRMFANNLVILCGSKERL